MGVTVGLHGGHVGDVEQYRVRQVVVGVHLDVAMTTTATPLKTEVIEGEKVTGSGDILSDMVEAERCSNRHGPTPPRAPSSVPQPATSLSLFTLINHPYAPSHPPYIHLLPPEPS